MTEYNHPFEKALSVSRENITLELRDFPAMPWVDFLLNLF